VGGIKRRLAAVAFADVAGWSHLVESNDLDALQAWNALRTGMIEPLIHEHSGRLVDMAGDAVFVEFPSAVDAVGWAITLQGRCAAAPGRLRLRIGINVGDLLVDDDRLVGDSVNIAARIHQLASPGEIVVTDAVREHVHHRIAVDFLDLGEQQLKNISRQVRVYRVEAIAAQTNTRARLVLEMPPPAPGPEAGGREMRWLQHIVAAAALQEGGEASPGSDGHGLRIDFAAAGPALRAAFAIQRACCKDVVAQAAQPHSLPRMAVHTVEQSGGPANGAEVGSRLSSMAGPGGIVVSAAVRDQLVSRLDADIEDLGECYLHAADLPVRAYRVEPPGTRPILDSAGAGDELRPLIAVIPFTEHGDGHASLGEILAEEVIGALSRSADLNVVSRLSTTAFRGRGASLGELSTYLKANYVLSGAYRVSAGSLILSAELADTQGGRVVWAKDMKGSVAGIVEGRDELIARVVGESSSAIMARELERTQSQSLHSLQTCSLLIGAIALMHRLSPGDFNRARDMLLAVVQRAPRHAVPRAWLAKWHVLRVWQNWSKDAAADTRAALDCGKHALDNDSHCSLALAIDGFVHANLLKSLDVAQQRYDLALRVNPNDSLAWTLSGMLHAFKGEGRLAVKGTRHGLRLSPLDLHHYFYDSLAASAEIAAGHYERAIELARRSLRANRLHSSTHRALAIAQWQAGRHDDARATVGELMKIEPQLTVSNWLQRSPSSDYPIGKLCAQALHGAGVPP
jgi:adenylate cyclase